MFRAIMTFVASLLGAASPRAEINRPVFERGYAAVVANLSAGH